MTVEEPVATLLHLLRNTVSAVKDDGSAATVRFSQEWPDLEILQSVDCEVSIGVDRCDDRKLNLAGTLRNKEVFLRLNLWSKSSGLVERVRSAIIAAIRIRRSMPNELKYDFQGVSRAAATHKAYSLSAVEGVMPSPTDATWQEAEDADYLNLAASDDARYVKISAVEDEYSLLLFRFKVPSDQKPTTGVLAKINLTFEGYARASTDAFVLWFWNKTLGSWGDQYLRLLAHDDVVVSRDLTLNLADYIDSDNCINLLAITLRPATALVEAELACDYVSCTLTVNGISYADPASFRDVPELRFKPMVYRSEIIVKSRLLEEVT